jgi:hypothetical protein
LAGQLDTPLGVEELAAALAAYGIRAQVRESSHYLGGRYIRVYEGDAHFTLECLTGEYLARADAASAEQVLATAARVSQVLVTLDVVHRFEVYGGTDGDLVAYLHHRWPEPGPADPGAKTDPAA